ncbi:MAG: 30S ribosomal protein S8 [Parcubacteria group bacterium]|nr:30S ribosomal protein S8 [Parcubacteria group bacterium]
MVNDPIGDLIIRLKNAGMVGKRTVVIPHSKLKLAVLEKLKAKGFVGSVEKKGKKVQKSIEVDLLYGKDESPRIQDVKRVSKPGKRVYSGVKSVFPVKFGKGALLLSTPKGILTGDEARKEKVGGEALFKIW